MGRKTYYADLAERLLEYITDETRDSEYYRRLAVQAPDARARALFLEFSGDEADHAQNFTEVYRSITGHEPQIGVVTPPVIPPYCQAIKDRIMAESGDFVKYGEEFTTAPDRELQNLFYITGAIENRHGLRLTTLLCGVQ